MGTRCLLVSSKPKRHYLPLKQRIQAYDEVRKLRRQGLSYSQIRKKIYDSHNPQLNGVRLSISTIDYWVRGTYDPLGKVNKFDARPSPELAYIIGIMLSDGHRYLHGNDRRIVLGIKDRECAENFGYCLTKVLEKEERYEPYWSESRRSWKVEACSILLFEFLDKPSHELRPYIEHCSDCVAAFLRAFFDGEGSIKERSLRVYNTNSPLLLYVQYLLMQHLGIGATGPHRDKKKGSRFRSPVNGKVYRRKKQCYYLYIPVKDLLKFYGFIGFTIKRKQRGLMEAIGEQGRLFFSPRKSIHYNSETPPDLPNF